MRLLVTLFIITFGNTIGLIPSGIIQSANPSEDIVYCAPGAFGKKLGEKDDVMMYTPNSVQIPSRNGDGCLQTKTSEGEDSESFIWMVERGGCSFQQKALNAFNAGASGIIVYNSLKGIYQNKTHASPSDFECKYGRGWVKELRHPVWGQEMTASIPEACTKDHKCNSGLCVLTNRTTTEGHEVCCAFDLYLSMGSSASQPGANHGNKLDPGQLPIPAVFIRMSDAEKILYNSVPDLFRLVYMYERYEPFIDPSSILIWLLALFVISYGSITASKDDDELLNLDIFEQLFPSQSPPSRTPPNSVRSAQGSGSVRSGYEHPSGRSNGNDDAFEVTPMHAVLWAICSACMLVVLFYVNLYKVIGFVYVIASAGASFLVVFRPTALSFLRHHMAPGVALHSAAAGLGLLCSKLLVLWWMVASYFESVWIWIPQDIMGFSVCVMAISVIRLPNFKVATMLLGMMFFYDIFFVFISPYFFSSSVMVKVASGGKNFHDDENFCEKYPDHVDCEKNALPMLFLIPSLLSYSSDGSILGLGDVVLPGLLLAFTARLDSRLFGPFQCDPLIIRLWLTGSFFPTFVAYAVGLFLANIAVIVFETGQPALLYIVPLILLAVCLWGYSRGCLYDLWAGPSVLYPEASSIVILNDGEDQGLLDSLPMAKKLRFANDANMITRSVAAPPNQPTHEGKRQNPLRGERYQTMADVEYLEDDSEEVYGPI